MSADENKANDRRIWDEACSQGNLGVFDELLAPSYIDHGSGVTDQGLEAVKQFVAEYHRAFPDIHFTIEDQVAEGDKLVTRYTARGTHQGEFMGIPATDKQATVSGITISRWTHGKVEETWGLWDTLGMLQQLGAAPAPGQAGA